MLSAHAMLESEILHGGDIHLSESSIPARQGFGIILSASKNLKSIWNFSNLNSGWLERLFVEPGDMPSITASTSSS